MAFRKATCVITLGTENGVGKIRALDLSELGQAILKFCLLLAVPSRKYGTVAALWAVMSALECRR